ncbi:hypothetical protein [Pseudomonas xanthosomatis]|uniref:hypothetical protein n=1 Tax=Pseudomonas xanthosomatis TaxID=2842356 RepID=UPI0035147D30
MAKQRSKPLAKASEARVLNVNVLVPPTVPELLPDIEGGVKNLLPFAATRLPLRVEFPMWANSNPSVQFPEHLELYWNEALVEKKTWTQPVSPHELFILVPTRFLSHGLHALHYKITLFNNIQNPSRPLEINIDREPPEIIEDDDTLLFDADIRNKGITEEYLAAFGDQVAAQIPPYWGAEPGDTLRWYLSDDPAGKQMAGMRVLGKDDVRRLTPGSAATKAPYTVIFEGDFIRQIGDGIRFARYEIQDRAGTATQRSLALSVTSKASPPPRVLHRPFIREAVGSEHNPFSTLLPAHASNGVTFVIPAATDIKPGETATIFWGEPGTTGAYHTSTPIAVGSREYLVPRAHIAPNMNSQVELCYQINIPNQPLSPSHFVTVRAITGLPIVQCAKIQNAQLNLRTMGEKAEFTLGEWLHRDTTQFVKAWIEGVDRNDLTKVLILPIVDALPVPTEGGIMALGSISKVELQKLALNYQFRVSVQVSFDKQASWLKFPDAAATLVDA